MTPRTRILGTEARAAIGAWSQNVHFFILTASFVLVGEPGVWPSWPERAFGKHSVRSGRVVGHSENGRRGGWARPIAISFAKSPTHQCRFRKIQEFRHFRLRSLRSPR